MRNLLSGGFESARDRRVHRAQATLEVGLGKDR